MTPQQLAKVMLLAGDMREASWDFGDKCYKTSWLEATENALAQLELSQDFAIPIFIALSTEYADIWDWANSMKEPA